MFSQTPKKSIFLSSKRSGCITGPQNGILLFCCLLVIRQNDIFVVVHALLYSGCVGWGVILTEHPVLSCMCVNVGDFTHKKGTFDLDFRLILKCITHDYELFHPLYSLTMLNTWDLITDKANSN